MDVFTCNIQVKYFDCFAPMDIHWTSEVYEDTYHSLAVPGAIV